VPAAIGSAELFGLPWSVPLAEWDDERIVVPRNAGLHRHVVRFIEVAGAVWAIKELPVELAEREYEVLQWLRELSIPCVPLNGVVADRGPELQSALITGYLEFSTTYRALFSEPRAIHPHKSLLDALVQLLARLHLAGVYWGDCSLSNTLFRLDAGKLAAYLVDSETAEIHPMLSDGQRAADLMHAGESIAGELFDLQAGGVVSDELDPLELAEYVALGYERLWEELTADWVFPAGQERKRIAQRVRRLNDLGYDIDELELADAGEGKLRLRVTTRVSEPGHHRGLLHQRTGLIAEENQARRLLNDLESYHAHLEREAGRPVSDVVAASRWLERVFDRVVASIPAELADKLDPVEVFHEVLEHRWFLSEQAGTDVGTKTATASYLKDVLPAVSDRLTSGRGPQLEEPPDGSS
jgi:hypothetical protein